MTLKIVLAFDCSRRFINDPSGGILPLGLLSMAACLKEKGHSVQVIHLARFSRKDALRLLSDGPPDIVGFSCFTFQRKRTLETAQRLRDFCGEGAPFIVLGGPHAGPLAREILQRCPWIDGVVRGEGEETILEIASKIESGVDPAGIAGFVSRNSGEIIEGPERELILELDKLPGIAESDLTLLGVNKMFQLRHLVTGRGCSGQCSFCSAPGIWKGKVRRNSIQWICREIDFLKKKYGLTYLSFRDDTFTGDPAWTREFCEKLILSDSNLFWDCQARVNQLDFETISLMRRAGCLQIQIGVESGSRDILRKLGKPYRQEDLDAVVSACRRTGMLVSFYLVSGVEGETHADIDQTELLVKKLRPASIVISRLVKYPGTKLAAGMSGSEWFDGEEAGFHVRNDKEALEMDARLMALSEEIEEHEPFSEAELKAAVETVCHAPPAALLLGQFYEDHGEIDLAIRIYKKILEDKPGDVWTALNLGDLLLELGEPELALPYLRGISDKIPRWPYPLFLYGSALIKLGKDVEGEELVEKSRRLEFGN